MAKIKTTLKGSVAHSPATDSGTGENVAARNSLKQTAAQVQAKAFAFAEKIADDDEATAMVEGYLNAKVDVALGPQGFYNVLKATHTDEELAETPIPGTKIEVTDPVTKVVTKHQNPDEYLAAKADGSIGTVSRYWHWDVADALPAGKEIQAELKRAAAMSEDDVAPEKMIRNANKRLANLRGLVAKGIALWHQINAVEGYANVEFKWDKDRVPVYETDANNELKLDKNGQAIQKKDKAGKPLFQWVPARTESPIIISNAEKDDEGKVTPAHKYMNVTQFLSLDVNRAMEKGGSYADLLATMRRDQPEEEEPEVPAINKVADFFDFALVIGNYLDNDTNYDFVKKQLAKRSEANDRALQALSELGKLLLGFEKDVPNAIERIEAIKKVA